MESMETMGLVINPRGPAGSGKTELVRRILAECMGPAGRRAEPLHREGRSRPIGYRLAHPFGGRPLVVLGAYDGTCGGCDTIGLRDGGLDGVFGFAGACSAAGCDVLLEGLVLSGEHRLSARFAEAHRLHILRLDTPVERSVGNLIRRRRAGWAEQPRMVRKVMAEHASVAAACARLAPVATVETLPFDEALHRARILLGLHEAAPAV